MNNNRLVVPRRGTSNLASKVQTSLYLESWGKRVVVIGLFIITLLPPAQLPAETGGTTGVSRYHVPHRATSGFNPSHNDGMYNDGR